MKYKNIKLNRLYNGKASVRDYIWKELMVKGMGIIFECNGAVMKLEPKELSKGDVNAKEFESKFDGRKYKLVDFDWNK
jgi:hypothetical protein